MRKTKQKYSFADHSRQQIANNVKNWFQFDTTHFVFSIRKQTIQKLYIR